MLFQINLLVWAGKIGWTWTSYTSGGRAASFSSAEGTSNLFLYWNWVCERMLIHIYALPCLTLNTYAEMQSNNSPELVKNMNRMLDETSDENCIKGFFFSKWILMHCSCFMIFFQISCDSRDYSEFGSFCCASNSLQLVAAWQTFKVFFLQRVSKLGRKQDQISLSLIKEIRRNKTSFALNLLGLSCLSWRSEFWSIRMIQLPVYSMAFCLCDIFGSPAAANLK